MLIKLERLSKNQIKNRERGPASRFSSKEKIQRSRAAASFHNMATFLVIKSALHVQRARLFEQRASGVRCRDWLNLFRVSLLPMSLHFSLRLLKDIAAEA